MKLIAIIIVPILIAVMPTSPQVFHTSVDPSHGDPVYNFSALDLGEYPPSNATFHFWNSGISNGFHAAEACGVGRRGLIISATHFGRWSFLNSALCCDQSAENLTVWFSWNDLLSFGLTEDYIVMSSGNDILLNISFGPFHSYETRIESSGNTSIFREEPNMDEICRLTVIADRAMQSYFVILGTDSSSSISLAIPIQSSNFDVGQNLTLAFGGECSNLTLYEVEVSSNVPKGIAENVLSEKYESQKSGGMAITSQKNFSGPYIVDNAINSILYVSSNLSVMVYNYYTTACTLLYNGTGDVVWASASSYLDTAYFILVDPDNYTFLQVNLTTLHLAFSIYPYTFSSVGYLQDSGGTLILFLTNGTIFQMNPSGVLGKHFSLQGNGGALSNDSLLYSGFNGNIFHIAFIHSGNSEITSFRIDVSSFTLVSESSFEINSICGEVNVTGHYDSVIGTCSIVSLESHAGGIIFSSSGVFSLPFNIMGLSSIGSGGQMLLGSDSEILQLDGNNITDTSIPYKMGAAIIPSSGFFFTAEGGKETLYNLSGVNPYSSFQIAMEGNDSYLMVGASTISMHIDSALPYQVQITLDGITYVTNTSEITINTSLMANGIYPMNFTAKNIAGYTAIFSSTARVDNGIPIFNDTLQNQPYSHSGEEVNYSVEWNIGISTIFVSYLSNTYSLQEPSGSFILQTGNYSGNMSVSFKITDSFGREFYFNSSTFIIYDGNVRSNLSIYNGEYLNSTTLNLSWRMVPYVYEYSVELVHLKVNTAFETSVNWINLDLSEGPSYIEVRAILLDNSSIILGSANFTVITEPPVITVKHSNYSYYSFWGNSPNSSLFINATTGNFSYITIRVYSPSSSLILNVTGVTTINYTVSKHSDLFKINGEYAVNISAEGMSRLYSFYDFQFYVNNTIPENPEQNGSIIYTNQSSVFIPGLTGNYDISLVNQSSSFHYSIEGSYLYMEGTGIYKFRLEVFSNSLNINTSYFSVYYFNESPSIFLKGYNQTLTSSSSMTIHILISDQSPLYSVVVRYGSLEKHLEPLDEQTVTITFPRDGRFNITVQVMDSCGNSNTSVISVFVEYYPLLLSYSEHVMNFYSFQYITAAMKGYNLTAFSETWYMNGMYVSSGRSLLLSSGIGLINVTLIIKDFNETYYVDKEIFTLGPYVFSAAIISVAAYLLYPAILYSSDEARIDNLLKECSGISFSEIRAESRKRRLKFRSVRDRINVMSQQGKARIVQDPDGNQYFIIKDGN